MSHFSANNVIHIGADILQNLSLARNYRIWIVCKK